MGLAIAAMVFGGMPAWLLAAFWAPVSHDLMVEDLSLGVSICCYFVVSAAGSLPAGRLTDYLGWRWGVIATSVLSAGGLLVVAIATTPLTAIAALSLAALGNSFSRPAASLALVRALPGRRRGLAFGVVQAAMPISTFLVGVALSTFSGPGTWRWAFGVAAGVAFTCAVLAIPLSKRRRRLHMDGREAGTVAPREAKLSVDPSLERSKASAGLLLALAVAGLFGTAATTSLGGFLVVYGLHRGLAPGDAGALLAAGSAVGVGVRVLVGYLADRSGGPQPLIVVAAMMASGGVGMLMIGSGQGTTALVVGVVVAFGLGWSWNGLFAFAVVQYGHAAPARAMGTVQVGMGMGAAVGPLLFGLVAAVSYPAAWSTSGAMLACAAALTVLVCRLPRSQTPSGP